MIKPLEIEGLPIPLEVVYEFCEDSYEESSLCVGEIECLVSWCNGYQIVVPRGTEFSGFFDQGGWQDTLRDLRAFPWYSKRLGGWSHAGFLKGARGIVDKGLFGTLSREAPIIFMGHSLGGAVAINAAGLLSAEGFNVAGVITLGAPRTLTRSGAKTFKKRGIPVWEFSNPGDPVPDVPFKWWGYRHVNEIETTRGADGYSILHNHMLPFYKEWVDTLQTG